MNKQQVETYVMRYLEATDCHIIEKAPTHVTVKFSPEADKDLTNRPYYWGFVERTGVPPETMTFTFVFDPDAMPVPTPPRPVGVPLAPASAPAAWSATSPGTSATASAAPPLSDARGAAPPLTPGASPAPHGGTPAPHGGTPAPHGGTQASHGATPVPHGGTPAPHGGTPAPHDGAPAPAINDSILGRYFGITPVTVMTGPGRIPRDTMTFGSRRLEQLFGVILTRGRFVRLFEQVEPAPNEPYRSLPFAAWLGVNYKLELACDMKRDELHSLGINLVTGEIHERFMDELLTRKLMPRLPAGIQVQPSRITVTRAATQLEAHLERTVKPYDHTWADEAMERHAEELDRVEGYYEELLKKTEAEALESTRAQYAQRRQEVDWQYRPRVRASVINCGLFHLAATEHAQRDETR